MPEERDRPRSTRKYDAILAPPHYPRGLSGHARALAIQKEFGADLGSARVHSQHVGLSLTLIAPQATHRYHPDGHPDAGQDRFDWVDRGDGVYLGLLREGAELTDEDREKARAARTEAAVTKQQEILSARYDELLAVPEAERDDDEKAEFNKLRRFLARMLPGKRVTPPPQPPAQGSVPRAVRDQSLPTGPAAGTGTGTGDTGAGPVGKDA